MLGKIRALYGRSRTYDLPISSSDAHHLAISRRLVGEMFNGRPFNKVQLPAYAENLVSYEKRFLDQKKNKPIAKF